METKFHSIRSVALLLFVSGLLLLSGLDKIEINIMEARNFVSAREMVQTQEYLLTTLNSQPRYEKPPLPTWLTAISGTVFGFDSLFAMRLPVVAITMLLVFMFYYHSKLMGLNEKHALNNGLILISSFYIFFAGRDNQWDMYTHSFMVASIFFLWKLFQEDAKQIQNALCAGLFLGFSILSKGPVSFYALFLPFLISYGVVYRIPFRRKWFYFAGMLFSGLVIGASWYIYVRLKDPESFNAIASRETSNWSSYEVKPFYYYWSFFLQSGLWAIPSLLALIYPYLKSRVSNLKAYQFSLLWTLLALIFLSVIPEKKVRYLVPVLIPLALTTGFYIEYLIRSFNKSIPTWERNVACFFSGIIVLVGFAYPFALIFILKEKLMAHLFIGIFSSLLMAGCAVWIIIGLIQKNFSKVFYSMIALFTVVVFALAPLSKELVYNPDYASASKALSIEKQYNVKTYSLSAVAPEIIWDFGKPIPVLEPKGNQVLLPVEKQFGLLVDMKDSASITKQFQQYDIQKLYRINLNYAKGIKDRLVKDYYLFSKVSE
jgi:4-amino-4-deoxy-L-arabinose transferase-like glycosyltransferase